jgi:hypothetical protein
MAPYAYNWQIKETIHSRTNSPRTDMKKLVNIIRQSGYRGYVPIETLKMGRKDYDPFAEAAKLLAELRAAIEDAEGMTKPASLSGEAPAACPGEGRE